jgi:hypothetical protein
MRRIVVSVLSSLLVATVLPGMATARDDAKKQRREYDKYAAMYPDATRRQLRNARAYDRGEYYEMDSNAHPIGSPSWWAVREREGRRR